MKRISRISLAAAVVSVLFTGILLMAADHDSLLRQAFDAGVRFTSVVEFPGLVSQQNNLCNPNCPTPAPDPVTGQLNFGLDSAGKQIAITPLAEFQGQSVSVGAPDIEANGRACVTCHRPDIRDASGNWSRRYNSDCRVPFRSATPSRSQTLYSPAMPLTTTTILTDSITSTIMRCSL